MKKKATVTPDRRTFLSLGLLGSAGLLAQSAQAMIPAIPEEDEKISMLTPDGKLVEVTKHILAKAGSKQKAANKDILDWTTTQIKTDR